MTDTGAVIRALKMAFAESVICDTLKITQGTLDIIKTDYDNLKHNFDQGRRYDDTAALLMKDPAEVWYAYHVFESDNKALEQEILDENEGKPRLKPPPVVKQKPKPGQAGADVAGAEKDDGETSKSKKEKRGVTKEKIKNAPKKGEINDALQEEGEKPAGAVLMEDAGRIAKELSERRQAIGKFVMDTMDLAARQFGYDDHISFLEFIYNHFINNYGKVEQKDRLIQELNDANQLLIETLSERNRRAFIARQIAQHVFETMERGHSVATQNLLAYAEFLEKYYRPVNTELLLKPEQEDDINAKATQQL